VKPYCILAVVDAKAITQAKCRVDEELGDVDSLEA
jgi:hypothetical protein